MAQKERKQEILHELEEAYKLRAETDQYIRDLLVELHNEFPMAFQKLQTEVSGENSDPNETLH